MDDGQREAEVLEDAITSVLCKHCEPPGNKHAESWQHSETQSVNEKLLTHYFNNHNQTQQILTKTNNTVHITSVYQCLRGTTICTSSLSPCGGYAVAN